MSLHVTKLGTVGVTCNIAFKHTFARVLGLVLFPSRAPMHEMLAVVCCTLTEQGVMFASFPYIRGVRCDVDMLQSSR